jgi:hypothetical protein
VEKVGLTILSGCGMLLSMDIIEYPKIPGPFKREVSGPNKNKVIAWEWTSPELAYLADTQWLFTEKVDGTNVRIIWDGHKPEFRGRTDKAQMPVKLMTALIEMFPEELFEQKFGSNDVILFGEGYGAGIQKGGGNYRQDNSFILFDVKVGPWWLLPTDVLDVADSLGIDAVPTRSVSTLREMISTMSRNELYSHISQVKPRGQETAIPVAEGVVGIPRVPMLSRRGERIMVKLKGCDLYGLELD